MYYDDEGRFKGEALIIYFKEGSVDLAMTLLDDTELEMGTGFGNMRVKVAQYEKSHSANEGKKAVEKKEVKNGEAGEEKVERKKPSAEEKQRMSKRIKTMQRLALSVVFRRGLMPNIANSHGIPTPIPTMQQHPMMGRRSRERTV